MKFHPKGTDMLYLEDFAAGQKHVSGTLRVDAAAIKAFAAQFDPQPFHLDEDAARRSFFGGLAASGWHTAALSMKLLVESGFRPAGRYQDAEIERAIYALFKAARAAEVTCYDARSPGR